MEWWCVWWCCFCLFWRIQNFSGLFYSFDLLLWITVCYVMIHVLLCGKVNISASLVAPRKKMIMYDRPINLVFQLNVDPSGPALDLEVPLEIIIGTIPLRQVVEQFPPHPASIQPPPPAGYSVPPGTMYPPPEGASAPYPPSDPSAPTAPFMPPSSIPNLRE